MSSTYTSSLQIQQIGNGEQSGTWGTTTNTNMALVDQAVAGAVTITMSNANRTLTQTNGTSDEARNMVLEVVGSNSGVYQIIVPYGTGGAGTGSKMYLVSNNTTGGYAITIGYASGSTVSIPNGYIATVFGDGTNFFSANTTSAGAFNVNGTLTASGVADVGNMSVGGTLGVTGASTFTGAAALNGTVSGTGIAAYMASPPAIGGTAAAAGTFTTVSASSVSASGAVSGASVSDTIGNVRNIPIEAKSTAYVLQASDNGQCISITTGGVTVPASVFAANNVVTIYNNSGSTQVITQGSGLTLQFAGQPTSTTGNRNLSLYGIATVLFLSPTSAVITGAGLY